MNVRQVRLLAKSSHPTREYNDRMNTRSISDLATLQEQMRRCRLCADAGYPITPEAIFSGVVTARIMVVGQAPGGREVDLGLPFSGPAGHRLFSWLEQAGFEEKRFREEQYITAITKCFPGKGKSRGDRVPTAAERKLCLPFLAREIELVRPELIVSIGGVAIRHFLGKVRFDDAIGQVYHVDGRSIVPLPHPSGANIWLNRPTSKDLLQKALLSLKTATGGFSH